MKNGRETSKAIILSETLLVLFFSYLWFNQFWDDAFFSTFMERDLRRADLVSRGGWIPHGPEMSGSGHLPGPFLYVLLAIALKIGGEWSAVWILLCSLNALSLVFLWIFCRLKWGFAPAVIAVVGISTSEINIINFLGFWNPSLLLPIAIIQYLLLLISFQEEEGVLGRKRGWWLLCITSGLAIQIHATGAIPLMAGILLHTAQNALSIKSPTTKQFLIGLLIFSSALIPFLSWKLLADAPTSPMMTSSVVLPDGEAKGYLLELVRKVYSIYREQFTLPLLATQVVTLISPLALSLILALLVRTRFLPKKKKMPPLSIKLPTLLVPIALAAIPAFLPMGALFYRYTRYGTMFSIGMLLLTSYSYAPPQHDRHRSSLKIQWGVASALTIITFISPIYWPSLLRELSQIDIFLQYRPILLLLPVLGGLILWNSKVRNQITEGVFLTLLLAYFIVSLAQAGSYRLRTREGGFFLNFQHMSQISDAIIELTNAPYDKIKNSIFFINVHDGLSIESIYKSRYTHHKMKGNAESNKITTNKNIDGFLVGISGRDLSDKSAALQWLDDSHLEGTLLRSLRMGLIKWSIVHQSNGVVLISYSKNGYTELPKFVQNRGSPYEFDEMELALQKTVSTPIQISDDGMNTFNIVMNKCPHLHPSCNTALRLHLERRSRGVRVDLQVGGHPISQPMSESINTPWAESWIQPRVRFECARSHYELIMANEVGFNWKFLSLLKQSNNNYLLSPLDYELTIPCQGMLRKIVLLMDGMIVNSRLKSKATSVVPVEIHVHEVGNNFRIVQHN